MVKELFYVFLNSTSRVVSANGPMFSKGHYSFSVPEDAALGTAIGRVEAASPSQAPLLYTIVSGNNYDQFSVDYNTGKIQDRLLHLIQ